MLILCTSKYIRLASCVHNSTHRILLSTSEYVHNAILLCTQDKSTECILVWSHLSRVQERPSVISNVN